MTDRLRRGPDVGKLRLLRGVGQRARGLCRGHVLTLGWRAPTGVATRRAPTEAGTAERRRWAVSLGHVTGVPERRAGFSSRKGAIVGRLRSSRKWAAATQNERLRCGKIYDVFNGMIRWGCAPRIQRRLSP